MENNNQTEFIMNVKAALKRSREMDSVETSTVFQNNDENIDTQLSIIKNKSTKDRQKLLDELIKWAKPLNVDVFPVTSASQAAKSIKKLVQEKSPEWGDKKSIIKWKHDLIDELKLEEQFSKEEVTVYTTESKSRPSDLDRETHRENLIESFVGITSADFCMADSATLVLRTRPNQPRAVSLVPSIHIAVIKIEQIIEDLKELYFRLNHDPKEQQVGITNCMTFISGPSKTADIELVMVEGAHGPRELILFVITG
jgi:L-lactate dehydrogenase complex protein LldG